MEIGKFLQKVSFMHPLEFLLIHPVQINVIFHLRGGIFLFCKNAIYVNRNHVSSFFSTFKISSVEVE